MNKKYIGYIDFADKGSRKGLISTALLAEFDADKLKKEEKLALEDYLDSGEPEEFFLDSTHVNYVYIGLDYINDPKGDVYVNINMDDNWPIFTGNVYNTYDEARMAFANDAKQGQGEKPERVVIKSLMA